MFLRTVLCCLGWLALVGSAQAYCRTHTADPPPGGCPDTCHNEGLPLEWYTPHLTYAFNVTGFPNIAAADLQRMISESMASWEAVSCGNLSIGIDTTVDSVPTTLTLGPKESEPNQNVIVYFSPAQWADNELGSSAYATTQVWFQPRTGQIIGADMMFNANMGPFGECPDTGCLEDGPRVDIRNVATHEFGHFLGLAHSEIEGATMYCNAVPREITKRMLTADDEAGLCAVYPPGQAFMQRVPSRHAGCALGAEAGGGWVLLALLLRRRRIAR